MVGIEEYAIDCPYCGEGITILIDTSIEQQEYIEDCQVCCQPMLLSVQIDEDQNITLTALAENE